MDYNYYKLRYYQQALQLREAAAVKIMVHEKITNMLLAKSAMLHVATR